MHTSYLKKYVFSAKSVWVLLLGVLLAACNSNSVDRSLPADVRSFLTTHFPEQGVESVRETKNFMDYEVLLENGVEVSFLHSGEWENINLHGDSAPSSLLGILPQPLLECLKEREVLGEVRKIERRSYGRNNFIYRLSFYKPKNMELNFAMDGSLISDAPEGKNLPSEADAFLAKNYPSNVVISIVEDTDGDYNVTLDDNTEINFNRKGNWFEMRNYKKSRFPESVLALLPRNVSKYMEKNYPDQFIRRIERKSYGYRVKLNKPNNVELTFSKSGEFLSQEKKGADSIEE